MAKSQIPLLAVPVMHALARSREPISFAELKEKTELAQATLNRILKSLCEYGYALKISHGKYLVGPELVDMGLQVTRNHIVHGFKKSLSELRRKTHLNAELYMITPSGPIFLTHSPARGEMGVSFQFGHLITNRDAHPAALFYRCMHEGEKFDGCKENFIVDRGRQWPELFRAASMIPGTIYCLALSGMLTNVGLERHAEVKEALQEAAERIDVP